MVKRLHGTDDTQDYCEYEDTDGLPRLQTIQVQNQYSPPKKQRAYRGSLPEDMFNFISAMSDRGQHKLHMVLSSLLNELYMNSLFSLHMLQDASTTFKARLIVQSRI